MIKKSIFLIIIILAILSLNISSYGASDITVYLEANKDIIEKGEDIQLSIYLTNEKTASYYANVYFDPSKFEFVSGPQNIQIEEDKINIIWYDIEGGSNAKTGKLEEITFRAKETGSTDFVIEGEFFNEKGQLIETNFDSIEIQIGNEESTFKKEFQEEQGNDTNISNANLKVLRVNEVGLVPSFNKEIFDYDITVENNVQDLEILAITENPNAKLEISR